MSGQPHDIAKDSATATIQAIPGVVGTIWSAVTLNRLVAVVTLILVTLQIAYLLWKWRRELIAHRRHLATQTHHPDQKPAD